MNPIARYAVAGLLLLALATGVLWPLLGPEGRRGVLLAAAVAWPVQVVAFGLLRRHRDALRRFLAAWVGGTLVRMVLIGVAAFLLTRIEGVALAPTLLALAGFFFGLLLLEPVFFRTGADGAGTTTASSRDDSDGI